MKSPSEIIVEYPGQSRSHWETLKYLATEATGEIRVASAYVTDRDLLTSARSRKRKLLTTLAPMDLASGATSIECLRTLLLASVEVRYLPCQPRFHAKVYLFGNTDAIVTSANMTHNAMHSNIEVGVRVPRGDVQDLIDWYESLWMCAEPLRTDLLASMSGQIKELRRQYARLKTAASRDLSQSTETFKRTQNSLSKLFEGARSFYLLNTNRRYDYKTETGGYGLEESMLTQGLAVVWESFRFASHMSAVKAGDVVMAFAKKTGITAVGVAIGNYEVIKGDSISRLRSFEEYPYPEWRVPTRWIIRVDDEDACPYRDAPNASFIDVSGEPYSDLRTAVLNHFTS